MFRLGPCRIVVVLFFISSCLPLLASGGVALKNCSGDFFSAQCSKNAFCVPSVCSDSASVHHCRCPDFFELLPDGICGSTPRSTAIVVFTFLNSAVLFAMFLFMLHVLWITHKSNVLRLDVLTICCVLDMVTAFGFTITRILFGVDTLDPSSPYMTQHNILEAISASFSIATAMVFGVAVHMLVMQSSNLRPMDSKVMRRRVITVAATLFVCNLVGAILIFSFGYHIFSGVFFGTFAIISWILFYRIIKYTKTVVATSNSSARLSSTSEMVSDQISFSVNADGAPIADSVTIVSTSMDEFAIVVRAPTPLPPIPTPTTRPFTSSPSRPNTHPGLQRHTSSSLASAQTLAAINLLSHRLCLVAFAFACTTCLYFVVSYIGKVRCDMSLVGSGGMIMYYLLYAVLTIGIGEVARFMKSLALIRIARKQGHTSGASY